VLRLRPSGLEISGPTPRVLPWDHDWALILFAGLHKGELTGSDLPQRVLVQNPRTRGAHYRLLKYEALFEYLRSHPAALPGLANEARVLAMIHDLRHRRGPIDPSFRFPDVDERIARMLGGELKGRRLPISPEVDLPSRDELVDAIMATQSPTARDNPTEDWVRRRADKWLSQPPWPFDFLEPWGRTATT
jgi:hypothetical protein